jgi:hypothetical protein
MKSVGIGQVVEKSGGASSALRGGAEVHVIRPQGIESSEALRSPELQRAESLLLDWGYRIGFEREPDGSCTAYLIDPKRDEVMKMHHGTDWQDALLGASLTFSRPVRKGFRARLRPGEKHPEGSCLYRCGSVAMTRI